MQWNVEWTWDGGGGGWLILMIKNPGNCWENYGEKLDKNFTTINSPKNQLNSPLSSKVHQFIHIHLASYGQCHSHRNSH